MHCINKMPKALAPGDDRGATVLIGAKAPMLDGSTIGWVLIPFVKLERPYDYIKELLDTLWEWWDEEGKFRERVGELIWRKGMGEVLKVLDLEPSPYMISSPRNNPFMFFEASEIVESDYVKELRRRGIKLKGEKVEEEE